MRRGTIPTGARERYSPLVGYRPAFQDAPMIPAAKRKEFYDLLLAESVFSDVLWKAPSSAGIVFSYQQLALAALDLGFGPAVAQEYLALTVAGYLLSIEKEKDTHAEPAQVETFF